VVRPELEEAVERVRTGRIASSTEATFFALDKMLQALAEGGVGEFAELALRLTRARPTSALLVNATRELVREVAEHRGEPLEEIAERARRKVEELKGRIRSAIEASAAVAERRIEPGDTLLTTSYSLFVKQVVRNVLERGRDVRVVVTESRPGGEGLRMASELSSMGCDVTLVVDSAVRYVMKGVDKVLLSAECVTANGAVVNKVGSSQIALAAHEARVRVFVVTTSMKFSPETVVGELVEIPEADASEVRELLRKKGLEGVKVKAPLFDVTPPEYIDAIITERGLMAPSFAMMAVRDLYGWPPKLLPLEEALRDLMKGGG